eukprot:COSAG02_NODE_2052_length_9999_cov_5.123636_4_plen_82_part_00
MERSSEEKKELSAIAALRSSVGGGGGGGGARVAVRVRGLLCVPVLVVVGGLLRVVVLCVALPCGRRGRGRPAFQCHATGSR